MPRDADTVLRTGYGDCKDHVTLLAALLAAEGIASEPALISTKSRYDLPHTPTLGLLDHVILYLPAFDLYADSTSPYAPFGVLPFGDYGKPVILARAHGSILAARARPAGRPRLDPRPIPTSPSTPDGTVTGETTTTAEGPSAITLREVASSIEDEGPAFAAEDQLRRLGTPGSGGFSFDTPLELGDSYGVQGHFTLEDKFADGAEDHFPVPGGLTVLTRGGSFLVSEDAVDHGRHLCYAGTQVETIHLELPKGVSVTALPREVTITGGFARYQASYQHRSQQRAGQTRAHRHRPPPALHRQPNSRSHAPRPPRRPPRHPRRTRRRPAGHRRGAVAEERGLRPRPAGALPPGPPPGDSHPLDPFSCFLRKGAVDGRDPGPRRPPSQENSPRDPRDDCPLAEVQEAEPPGGGSGAEPPALTPRPCAVDGLPDAFGSGGHVEAGDAVFGEGVDDGVHDGGWAADGARPHRRL